MPSHKTFRTKTKLAKAGKQNRPIPQVTFVLSYHCPERLDQSSFLPFHHSSDVTHTPFSSSSLFLNTHLCTIQWIRYRYKNKIRYNKNRRYVISQHPITLNSFSHLILTPFFFFRCFCHFCTSDTGDAPSLVSKISVCPGLSVQWLAKCEYFHVFCSIVLLLSCHGL